VVAGLNKTSTDAKMVGRDGNGMFHDHKKYVKARNQLNLEEEKHRGTLENIDHELDDPAFLATAL